MASLEMKPNVFTGAGQQAAEVRTGPPERGAGDRGWGTGEVGGEASESEDKQSRFIEALKKCGLAARLIGEALSEVG